MKKGLITDFTSGNIWKQLVVFSMPLFFANLLQMVYNMVDMIVVGHVIGNVGISGVTIGGDISHFFTMLVMGFSAAASIIISQFVGAGQKEKVGKEGEGEGRGVQRGKLRKGEKCRLLLRFSFSPPSFGFPFAKADGR